MEAQGRSYKNHFSCVEMPERQTGSRHTGRQRHTRCQIQTKRRGTTMCEATIKKYKRADSQGGAGGLDTRGHEERQAATHTSSHTQRAGA